MDRQSAWVDVQAKAKRIYDSGDVTVESYSPYEIHGTVIGDTDWYSTEIHRKDAFGLAITWFDCSCKWGYHTYNTIVYPPYVARVCSHTLALFYAMQSLDFAYQKLKKGHRMAQDDTEALEHPGLYKDTPQGALESQGSDDGDSDMEEALGIPEDEPLDPVVQEFIDWMDGQGLFVDDINHSTVVGLAVEFAEENSLDAEDLTTALFAEYYYDPEADPTREGDPSQEALDMLDQPENDSNSQPANDDGSDNDTNGDTVDAQPSGEGKKNATVKSRVATPMGAGVVVETSNEGGIAFAHVAGTDHSGREFREWFLHAELEPVRTFTSKTAGKKYDRDEQQSLIEESADSISPFTADLDLKGTHYLDETIIF